MNAKKPPSGPKGPRGPKGPSDRSSKGPSDRPPRPPGARPPFRGGSDRPARPAGDRPPYRGARDDRPARPSGEKPPYRGSREDRPARPSTERPAGDRPPYRGTREDRPARPAGDRPPYRGAREDRPARPPSDRPPFRGPRPDRKSGPPRSERPYRPARSDRPDRGARAPREPWNADREPAPARPAEPLTPPPGARLAGVEELTVRIEKLVAGGEGLARYEGVPIFVPRSAPGDLLLVRVVERHPSYGRAEIVELLEAGPLRRPVPYPDLARTGACDLQHIDDRAQTNLKAVAVRETLEHIGHFALPGDPEVLAGEPWHCRLRTQLHTAIDPSTGAVLVGYHARGSNDVIHLTSCALLVPELERLLAELPARLVGEPPRRLDLAAGDDGTVTVAPMIDGLPHGEVSTTVGDFNYAYDARCFFQSHRGLLPQLVDRAVGAWKGETAVDLYSGVGLFSLPLARNYEQVIAVESDTIATRFARLNGRRNRITNVDVVTRAVESWIEGLPKGIDRVLVDPPRAGLSGQVRDVLLRVRPRRLTYVSCHPATLARDLRQLLGTFQVESVAFLDLFPQTGHMEVVVQLVAAAEAG